MGGSGYDDVLELILINVICVICVKTGTGVEAEDGKFIETMTHLHTYPHYNTITGQVNLICTYN